MDPAVRTEQQPHELVWSITNAVVASRALHVVADLGVADHIAGEPVSAAELAERCGAHAEALDRVLRLLATLGVFEAVDGASATRRRPSCCAPTTRCRCAAFRA